MMQPARRESLLRATAEASARFRRTKEELGLRQERPPQPGDLWVFRRTAELPLEWMVLERAPDEPAHVLVVPADTNPVAGRADVAVPKEAACGPLRLRCACATWIAFPKDDGTRRTGVVEDEFVRRARERYAAWKAEPGAHESDTIDVEYEDWIDDVVKRGTRILAAADAPAPSRALPAWATAATVFLALGLGFTAGRIPRTPAPQSVSDRVAPPAAEPQRTELRNERGDDRPPESPAASKEATAPRPLVNLPFVWLGPSETLRGPAPLLTVAPDGTLIVIVLQVDDPEPQHHYRLDVHSALTGRTAWSGRGLVKTGVSELALALPRALLPAGPYSLRLYDEPSSGTVRAEYALRIEHARPTSPTRLR